MKASALVFMALTWAGVVGLNLYCIQKLLSGSKK
jgi:hypothetical protein